MLNTPLCWCLAPGSQSAQLLRPEPCYVGRYRPTDPQQTLLLHIRPWTDTRTDCAPLKGLALTIWSLQQLTPWLLSSPTCPSHRYTLLPKGLSCSWSRPVASLNPRFPAVAGLDILVPPTANPCSLQYYGPTSTSYAPVLWVSLMLVSGYTH